MTNIIAESELILNADKTIYHLHLHPEELAQTIITVGDPDRVMEVSKHFDRIEVKKQNREYITHTGYIKNKRISVISTGIGVNSIDIVINELDALANIDFTTREIKQNLTQLDIIRIGTSGTIQADIPVDSFLSAEYSLGIDCLLHYYQQKNSPEELAILTAFFEQNNELIEIVKPYITRGEKSLLTKFSDFAKLGITLTCEGFYAPQGRILRLQPVISDFIDKIAKFRFQNLRVTNLEMETAAIYGLGQALNHNCISLNAIIANRATKEFSKTHKQTVEKLITLVLEKLAQ